MFEFLFKYPIESFGAGRFVSVLNGWQWALLPLAVAALAYLALGYFRLRGRTRGADRAAISLLRGLVLTLVLFSLSRPLLEVSERTPQPAMVGVLLDNSLSMQLAERAEGDPSEAAARGDFIRRQFAAGSGPLLRDLEQRFDVRLFGFGAGTQAIESVDTLDFADGGSDLTAGLGVVEETLKGVPLAGLVVVSDGALPSGEALDARLRSLQAKRIPVYSIGVGEPAYARDIEISRIRMPGRVLNGSRVFAEVSIRQQGYDDQLAELVVEDDSRILHKQEIRLRPGTHSYRIPLAAGDAGARRLEFQLAPLSGERIEANNRREAILEVSDRKMRILYFEGEPRFEMKFVRRAVDSDENLGVRGLVRTADAKFYRVGIESPDELRNGFPATRDELFSYDAIILGSVETTLLSLEQQQMIVEFVSERGGGLLLLGGRHAFTEGGYRDSVLREIMPVVMAPRAQPEFSREIRIQPTAAAWVHPALLLADSTEKSIDRWLTLPPLTIVNPIRELKPGATLLLAGADNEQGDRYVAMAWQRYGRGKVVAFAVQNSWLWQMHHEIDLEDQSHELLWRQLLRWLVESVPPRLELSLSTRELHAGGEIALRAEVLNADFSARRDAELRAVVTAPDGVERAVALTPHATIAGVYETSLRIGKPGDYRVHIELQDDERVLRSSESRFRASRDGDEYFQSEMNEKLLRRIANESGGRFFRAGDAGGLADALRENRSGARTLQRHELWDMPILFLLLVLLLCAEWSYRRWRGLT